MDLTLFNKQMKSVSATSEKGLQVANDLMQQKQEMLQNPAVQAKLSPNEFSLAVAGAKQPIRLMDSDEVLQKAVLVAKGVCRDVGIKHWDNIDAMKYEATRFYDILKKYYSDLTISEVKMAFEVALIGELDDYLPKDKDGKPDKNHYQTFSVEYFTKILNAYRHKRSQVWGKVRQALPSAEILISEKERKAIRQGFINEIYDAYINYQKGVMPCFSLSVYIKHLHDEGHIKELPKPTKDDYDKAYTKVITNSIITRPEKKRIIEMHRKGDYAGVVTTEAELICYNKATADIFESWKKRGFDLIDTEK